MAIILTGIGTPEGVMAASLGTFYIDTENASLYIKMNENERSTSGWAFINHRGFIEGDLDPTTVGVSAVRGSVYYNPGPPNKMLFMQMTESTQAQPLGWVALGNVSHGKADPTTAGNDGDVYINTTYFTLYIYANLRWNIISLISIKEDNTFKNLSELLTNSVSLANTTYDMFYNNVPLDIHIPHYDSNGELKIVDLPNRAKDTNTILGKGNPEGEVFANMGKFYVDTTEDTNIKMYLKTTSIDSNLGWIHVSIPRATAPLVYTLGTNTYSLTTDATPTQDSINMVNSGTLYTQFSNKADKEGNKDINFKAAFPIDDNDVASKEYVDGWFRYDAATKSLIIQAPIKEG